MADAVATALIAALSALGGAAVAHWGAARLQTRQMDREAERERRARVHQSRADCLGWVLETAARMDAALQNVSSPEASCVSPAKTAAAAARQAYAAALLSLAAARPAARAFYLSSARLQLALSAPSEEDAGRISGLSAAWRADYETLENLLANLADDLD